jgi:polar amino acid transport system substrate-binding protein
MSFAPTRRRAIGYGLATAAAALLPVRFAAAAENALAPEVQGLAPDQPGAPKTQPNAKAIAALPQDFAFVTPGKLTVAVSAFAPPLAVQATDGKTLVGADPEIASLVAQALGLELELVAVAWPDWPLGVSSGRFDAVISNVGVTEERKEKYDFATYRQGVHGFYVPIDSKIQSITEPKDIAGLKIITGSGAIQERILLEWNRLNEQAGLAPADLLFFDDDAAETLALLSGRADANFNPNGTQAWNATVSGKTRRVGLISAGWPNTAEVGVVTKRGNGLAPALVIALNGVIGDGAYAQVLTRWGLTEEAVGESRLNPPGLPKF